MTGNQGIPQSKHLERIEPDQSIQGINNMDNTIRTEAGRKWFISQAMLPHLSIGQYNSITGRFEFSHGQLSSYNDTASDATATLTCPANRIYRVLFVSALDATTATSYVLQAVIGGTTITLMPNDVNNMPIGETHVIMGTTLSLDSGGVTHPTITIPITLRPGDTMTVTASDFVALDNMDFWFIFEEIAYTP